MGQLKPVFALDGRDKGHITRLVRKLAGQQLRPIGVAFFEVVGRQWALIAVADKFLLGVRPLWVIPDIILHQIMGGVNNVFVAFVCFFSHDRAASHLSGRLVASVASDQAQKNTSLG